MFVGWCLYDLSSPSVLLLIFRVRANLYPILFARVLENVVGFRHGLSRFCLGVLASCNMLGRLWVGDFSFHGGLMILRRRRATGYGNDVYDCCFDWQGR